MGTCCEGITEVPTLSEGDTLLSRSGIAPTSDSFTPNSHLALSHQQNGQLGCAREGSPLLLLRAAVQLSQSRHLLFGFLVLGLQANSGPSNADHKLMGVGIFLCQLSVHKLGTSMRAPCLSSNAG